MDSIAIVQQFCDAMAARDPEVLRPLLAEAVVYQNVGMPASRGLEEVLANLAGQFGMFPDSYAYETVNIAASGDVVLTERLDMIKGPDGVVHGVPVMGAFEVENGVITRWTDYWDTSLPVKMLSGEDYHELVPAP